jgi:hypothetical protein
MKWSFTKWPFPKWWPWLPPGPGDIIAIAIGIGLAVALLLSIIVSPHFWRTSPNSNSGFGPEWNCTYVPQSEPVCTKRPGTTP